VAPVFNKLTLAAGVGNVLDPAGLYVYIGQQIITSPVPQDFARFGASIFISDNTTTLAVGAPNGSTITYTTFDNNTTVFDPQVHSLKILLHKAVLSIFTISCQHMNHQLPILDSLCLVNR